MGHIWAFSSYIYKLPYGTDGTQESTWSSILCERQVQVDS
jgi:hypothetical protein